MKRQTVFALPAVVFLMFSAIAGAEDIQVGLAWMGKSGSSHRILEILKEDLKKMAPNIRLEVQAELESEEKMAEVVQRFHKEKAGMIIFRSNGAEWLAKNPPSIPTFIGSVNHPGYLNVIKNLDAPEGSITGSSFFVPAKTQFEIFRAIIPDLNSVWLLLEKDHPGSAIDQDQIRKQCAELNIAYNESFSSTREEVLASVKEAVEKRVSAILVGTQAVTFDNAKAIVAQAGKIPTFSFMSPPVKDGILGGFLSDEDKLMHMLAESVTDVLIKGKAIKDVAVKFDTEPKFVLNETTAARLQLTIPYEILRHATLVR